MTAYYEGQVVQFYPKRGGQLATLNAISAITPLQAKIVTLLPLYTAVVYVNDPSLARPYLVKNVPYFDSEYLTRPYQTLIPGDGGYCVDPTDLPPFPPPVVVPYQPASWNMPVTPAQYPSNPADSEQPYAPVKIMENDTTTPTAMVHVAGGATVSLDLTPLTAKLNGLTFQFPVANGITTVVSFVNPPASGIPGSFTVQVTNGGPTSAVTWPAAVTNRAALVLSGIEGVVDTFVFSTSNGGTAYAGQQLTAPQ